MALLIASLLMQPGGSLGASPTARDIGAAQAALAAEYGGAPEDYILEAESALVAGGAAFWAAKFRDTKTAAIRLIYRDVAGNTGGKELPRAAVERSQAGLSAIEQKASPELLAAATEAKPDDVLPIAIWMDVDTSAAVAAVIGDHPEVQWEGDRPNSPDLEVQRKMRHLLDEARGAVYAKAAAEIEAAVKGDGAKLGYVSLLAPLTYFDGPAASIERMADHPRTRSLGLEGGRWVDSLSSAGPYVDADWHSGSLDQGTGVRVGVIEYYNVRESGDLAGKVVAFHSESGSTTYTPSSSFDHPTWVAGAIASQDAMHTGIAPGALIVSSGTGEGSAGLGRDRNVIRAADWAATTGDSDIINVSVNMDNATGRDEARAYFDSIAGGETFRTVIVSAGNYGTGADADTRPWDVSSPGTAWNVLTVGGVNDGTNQLWYDNVSPKAGALWQENPDWTFNSHGDFNKPNVSAPAVNVETANGKKASGTSVATPIVSGIAAQVFARNPSTFSVWPEAMRAIIMAGANRRVPLPGGGTNTDHEGVGTVHTLWSHRVYVGDNSTYGGWMKGSLIEGQTLTKTFSVTAGERVRIALTWDSHTTGSMFAKTDTLTADLDLSVSYPGGSASSLSFDNSYEFVSFTAPQSGTVTVRVNQPRFDRSSEFYGLAWLHW